MIIINRSKENTSKTSEFNTEPIKISRKKMKSGAHDLNGRTFGDFTVTGEAGSDKSKHILWKCTCNTCGESFVTTAYELLSGRKNTKCKRCTNHMSNVTTKIKTEDSVNDSKNAGTGKAIDDYNKDSFWKNFKKESSAPVFTCEAEQELLNMPVFFYIAYCQSADLKPYGTAKHIDMVYDMVKKLKDDARDCANQDALLHKAILIENVFNLFPNKDRHDKVTMETLQHVVLQLAHYCLDLNIRFLAMPRIGCGMNGLNWDEVRPMIVSSFTNVYSFYGEQDTTSISIVFCNKAA